MLVVNARDMMRRMIVWYIYISINPFVGDRVLRRLLGLRGGATWVDVGLVRLTLVPLVHRHAEDNHH